MDYFQKPVNEKYLIKAIQQAFLTSNLKAQHISFYHQYNTLTQREKAVLTELIKGLTNRQIALNLNVSLRTIEAHRSNMMKKLKASNLVDLMRELTPLLLL